jgi:hypothetical protein
LRARADARRAKAASNQEALSHVTAGARARPPQKSHGCEGHALLKAAASVQRRKAGANGIACRGWIGNHASAAALVSTRQTCSPNTALSAANRRRGPAKTATATRNTVARGSGGSRCFGRRSRATTHGAARRAQVRRAACGARPLIAGATHAQGLRPKRRRRSGTPSARAWFDVPSTRCSAWIVRRCSLRSTDRS